jgi:hypothetical protein
MGCFEQVGSPLPLLRVVGGTYVSGDMTLAMPKMKVLEDWLD